MEIGAHLPLISFGSDVPTLPELRAYTQTARAAGYRYLCANDHLSFQRPWLDGPTALASVIEHADGMTLATTIALSVIRGPAPLAKTLVALDRLSGGQLVAGVGPGSSPRDYELVGASFEDRWQLFDDSVARLRELFAELEPPPMTPAGPPIWIGSWGSPAGLRRVKRLADGWLASAYNISPEKFAEGVRGLPEGFPNGVGTLWMYITESREEEERILGDVLAPVLRRDVAAVRDLALPIGPAERCRERMQAWADAGAQRLFVWPLADEVRQLELFADLLPLR